MQDRNLMQEIMREGPSESSTLLILQRLLTEGRIREALPWAHEALRRYPRNLELRLVSARLLLEAGFTGLAEAELEAIEEPLQKLSEAFKLRARICLRQRRYAEARQALDRYLAHRPEDPEAAGLAAQLAESQRVPDEDLADTLNALAAPRGDAPQEDAGQGLSSPTLAEIYLSQGQTGEAVRIYREYLERSPDNPEYRERLEELERTLLEQERPPATNSSLLSILERWLGKIQVKRNVQPVS